MKFNYKVKLNGVYYPANTEISLSGTVEAVKSAEVPDSKPKTTSKKASKK